MGWSVAHYTIVTAESCVVLALDSLPLILIQAQQKLLVLNCVNHSGFRPIASLWWGQSLSCKTLEEHMQRYLQKARWTWRMRSKLRFYNHRRRWKGAEAKCHRVSVEWDFLLITRPHSKSIFHILGPLELVLIRRFANFRSRCKTPWECIHQMLHDVQR